MSNAVLSLRSYQTEALDAVDAELAKGILRTAVVLPTGTGKGHPLHTEVPTPEGLRTWGELQVGDRVYGADGFPTEVTAIYDRGDLPTYRVTMKHGETVDVDGDHLWQVQRKGRKSAVMSTADLAAEPLKDRDGWKWSVPVAAPVHRYLTDLPLHPYVVGALIANGGMTHSGTMLTTPDRAVIDWVRECGVTANLINDATPGVCERYSLPGLMEITRSIGIRQPSNEKRIPRLYLEAQLAQRVQLLRGLMDSDGGSGKYVTTSRGLAFDVRELVTSLGGTCSINENEGVEYVCRLLLPLSNLPFQGGRPRSAIIDIKPTGEVQPIRCITVAARDSLYLITRNHIVTHNTVVFSHLIKRETDKGKRVVVMVHRDELAQQAANKVRSVAPGVSIGIVKAELNEIHADVLVCSVQTLSRQHRLEQIDPATIGVVIVDECHHAVARTWIEVLTYFGCWEDGGTPAVGFTATMHRDDGRGLGNVWESVAFEREIEWAIECGFLTDVRGRQVTIDGFDLAQIARSHGDYQEGKLGDALESIGAGDVVASAYLEHASTDTGVKRGVLFAPTVSSAYHFAQAFTDLGIRSAVIEGSTSREDRALIYQRYDAGDIDVLHNCMVLTEGWDSPATEVCVVARPTQNPALYTQMVGRVLRPFPGKGDALVLDVVGIAGRHALQSLTTLTKVEVLEGESISEAQTRVAEEYAEAGERQKLVKAHQLREVELFANSHSTWLRTKGAHWFIPVRINGKAASVVLHQVEDGTWNVGTLQQQRGTWTHKGLTFDFAMAWGEELANELDPTLAEKGRAWRRTKPSEAQMAQAMRLKLAPIEELSNMKRGMVSDLLSVAWNGRDIDKVLGR